MVRLKSSSNVSLNIFVLLLTITSTCASLTTVQSLQSRDDCGTNATWQATKTAWVTAKADESLALWWQDVSSKQHSSLANELAKGFGEHLKSFECGISSLSTCVAPKCSAYEKSDPVWPYLTLKSVANLNQFVNTIYKGITDGQAAYLVSMDELVRKFFSSKEPSFVLEDAALWTITLINSILAIPAAFQNSSTEPAFSALALAAFVGAGVKEVSNSLGPDILILQKTKSQGLAGLGTYVSEVEKASLRGIERWANATMKGEKDAIGGSILNYLHKGSFLSTGLPTSTEIEQYYKKQMIARTINAQWKKDKLFVMFFKTDNPNDTVGPNVTKYYSAEDGGVYYLYRYKVDGPFRSHLDKPYGIEHLDGTTYGISGNEITKSAARAFRATGELNYTPKIATERIIASMASNGTSSPFKDGAGWEGTWTFPVCDTGTNNWNTQFNNRTSRYGLLPCCCGPNCKDTKAFAKAVFTESDKLKNADIFQTLVHGCKAQLRNHETLKFDTIDYGVKLKMDFHYIWEMFSKGQKFGVGLGFGLGFLTIGLLLKYWDVLLGHIWFKKI